MINSLRSGLSRRAMLKSASCGFGYLALAGRVSDAARQQARAASATPGASLGYTSPLILKATHFPARAKRIIFLFMQGGPSHLDTFDYKPRLVRDHGSSSSGGGGKAGGKLLASPFKFKKAGQSGIEISEVFPHLSKHADGLCLINSMHTSSPAHPQATIGCTPAPRSLSAPASAHGRSMVLALSIKICQASSPSIHPSV